MTDRLVPIIMGSDKDMEHVERIVPGLDEFEIPWEPRVISAHKAPEYLLKAIGKYENSGNEVVFVTCAGRSDGLSATTANNTVYPVMACPPYSNKYSGMDLLSTIRTPSGSSPHLVLEPKNVGLEVAKIYAVSDSDMRERVRNYEQEKWKEVMTADTVARQTGLDGLRERYLED